MISIEAGKPALILAPMEGVLDAPLRALFWERGGFAFCVSEFLRVSQDVLPSRTILASVPELRKGSVQTQVQLLGGNPERVAESALAAVAAGAAAIDLNFGCPAPVVNRHDGGAALLKAPDRIRAIVEAVRKCVPRSVPVSAKLRLGWDAPDAVLRNASEAAEGGAAWITIHARTRMQGYAPPVDWSWIGRVRERLSIPVVANGDIWGLDELRRCREQTACEHFMIGRAALADPGFPLVAARELGCLPISAGEFQTLEKRAWMPLFDRFNELAGPYGRTEGYVSRRIKQWLRIAHARRPLPWLPEVLRLGSFDEIQRFMNKA